LGGATLLCTLMLSMALNNIYQRRLIQSQLHY